MKETVINRSQVGAILSATLAIILYVLAPRPYSILFFWLLLGVALLAWLLSLWLRYRAGGDNALEARTEARVTAASIVALFLIGWLVGWLLDGMAEAWLFGIFMAIVGFILALAPLRHPPRPARQRSRPK